MNPRGFTLIELLVALGIASIAIAGAFAGLSPVLDAWQATQAQQRLQERALYVLATLEPEVQMAGFFGSAASPPRIHESREPVPWSSCGHYLSSLQPGIDTWSGRWPLDCPAQGGGAVEDSQILVIKRASAGTSTAEPGRVQLLDSESAPAIRQIRWDGEDPATPSPSDLVRRDVLLRAYYIARESDGDSATPALRVKSLTAVAGRPAFVDTEVMPGVAALSVELLPMPEQPASVRITLLVQADAADSRHGRVPARVAVSRHFALRNAPRG